MKIIQYNRPDRPASKEEELDAFKSALADLIAASPRGLTLDELSLAFTEVLDDEKQCGDSRFPKTPEEKEI